MVVTSFVVPSCWVSASMMPGRESLVRVALRSSSIRAQDRRCSSRCLILICAWSWHRLLGNSCLKWIHYGRISFLKLLQNFHSMLCFREFSRQLVSSLKYHDPQRLIRDYWDNLLEDIVTKLMKN
jgi:hypothetical protein